MIIKKAKYKTVTVKQKKRISGDVHGCDECGKEIKDFPNEESRLDIRIFKHDNSDTVELHFCSWACVFKYTPKIKTDYFFTLPYVSFDTKGKLASAKEFLELVKKINKAANL
jgi:hypothetical protein